jgi:hypothetical protein
MFLPVCKFCTLSNQYTVTELTDSNAAQQLNTAEAPPPFPSSPSHCILIRCECYKSHGPTATCQLCQLFSPVHSLNSSYAKSRAAPFGNWVKDHFQSATHRARLTDEDERHEHQYITFNDDSGGDDDDTQPYFPPDPSAVPNFSPRQAGNPRRTRIRTVSRNAVYVLFLRAAEARLTRRWHQFLELQRKRELLLLFSWIEGQTAVLNSETEHNIPVGRSTPLSVSL